jgi:raffinose/stachyose/melibiose transport system permease protein
MKKALNTALSLLKKFGFWLATLLSAIVYLFIINPLYFIVRILSKVFILIIDGFRLLISVIKNKGKSAPLVELSKTFSSIRNFLVMLSIKRRYKGHNKFLRNFDNKVMGSRTSLLYVEIFTFVLLLLFFAPFALIIVNATKTANQIIADPLEVGTLETFWKNIMSIVTTTSQAGSRMRYWESFFNSIIITSGSLLTIGVFSAMAAWVLVRTKKKYSKIIFLLFLSGMVIPFQVVMLPLVRLLEVITTNLNLGMKDTYHGVILVYIGFGSPLSVFMFHGFIKSIPMDIEEAAIIDGCSRSQLFFRIIIPILKPIFVTLLVLNGLWIWNDYLLPSLVIGITGEVRTLPLAVANLAGAYVRQWDLLLTSVLLAAIPVIILFLFAQRFIIKGMTSGAIK